MSVARFSGPLAMAGSGMAAGFLVFWLLFGHLGAMGFGLLSDFAIVEKLQEYLHREYVVWEAYRRDGVASALWHALVESSPLTGNTLHYWLLQRPLEMLAPFPQSYNAQGIVISALNAAAMAALALALSRSPWAAFMAGIIFAVNPIPLQYIKEGKVRESIFCLLPLYALFLTRALQAERVRLWDLVAAGLCLAGAAVLYWFYAHFLLFLTVIFFAVFSLQGGWKAALRGIRVLFCIGLVALNVGLPFMLSAMQWARETRVAGMPLLGVALPEPAVIEAMDGRTQWNGIPAGSLKSVLWGSLEPDYPVNLLVRAGQPPLLLILAGAGAVLGLRRALPWLLAALLFYLLSLGPFLRLSGEYYPSAADAWPLPFYLAARCVPFFYALFHPDRAAVFFLLCSTVLASLAVAGGAQPGADRTARGPFLAVLGTVSWLALIFSFPGAVRMRDWEVPVGYARLDGARGWIIEAPLQRWGDGFGLAIYQRVHRHRIVYGYVMPYPHDRMFPAEVFSNPLYQWLNAGASREDLPPRASGVSLARAGVDWVVLHEQWFLLTEPDAERAARRYDEVARGLRRALGPPRMVGAEKRAALQDLAEPGPVPGQPARGGRWRIAYFRTTP